MKLSEVIKKFNLNQICTLLKDGEFEVIDNLGTKSTKKVCSYLNQEKFLYLLSDNVTSIIINKEMLPFVKNKDIGICVTDNPRILKTLMHNYLSTDENYKRKEFDSIISKDSIISDRATIAPKNVIINDGVRIGPNVVINENVTLGKNVTIGANSVIGADGFEYIDFGDKKIFSKHLGGVVIEDNVSVHQLSNIDKAIAPDDDTRIGEYTKIDSLVHIGHAAKIGKATAIAANSVIGGSTKVGNHVWIGIGSTVSSSLTIGDYASVKMGSAVTKNVESNQEVSGNFAIEHNKHIQMIKQYR